MYVYTENAVIISLANSLAEYNVPSWMAVVSTELIQIKASQGPKEKRSATVIGLKTFYG